MSRESATAEAARLSDTPPSKNPQFEDITARELARSLLRSQRTDPTGGGSVGKKKPSNIKPDGSAPDNVNPQKPSTTVRGGKIEKKERPLSDTETLQK
jgi:hypothetical protein